MSELKDYTETKEAELEKVSFIRVDNNYKGNTFAFRTEADIDYSRVLYSSSCRRLQGKMQLFFPRVKFGTVEPK